MSHELYFPGHIETSSNWDTIYQKYIAAIMNYGDRFQGRNGETRALFGCSVTVDLSTFPLIRLRKMPVKNLFREFLFDIGFTGNVEALGKAKHFWDFLADENGELGASAYNRQWRRWPKSGKGAEVANESLLSDHDFDQLRWVVNELKETRNSRRATLITTNPTAIKPGCPPCHLGVQFMPRGNYLDAMVPARSNDMIVGFPLDIARYAIMVEVVAQMMDFEPGKLYMPSSNSHIYENCYDIAHELLTREPKAECTIHINPKDMDSLELDDFCVDGYENPHPAIKVAVN